MSLVKSSAIIAFRAAPVFSSWRTMGIQLVLVPAMTALFLLAMSATALTPRSGEAAAAAGVGAGCISAAIIACLLMTEDRFNQTLSHIVLSRKGVVGSWAGRVLVFSLSGFVSAAAGIGCAFGVTGVVTRPLELLGLSVVVFAGVLSAACFGVAVGALSSFLRDAMLPANLTQHGLILISGIVAPLAVLPSALEMASTFLPITHAVWAARSVMAGGSGSTVASHVAIACALGAVWVLIAVVGWRVAEALSRRNGSLDFTAV